ncbi:MAG: hypothetical protein AAF467_26550 [Actinomycetota bacterium]
MEWALVFGLTAGVVRAVTGLVRIRDVYRGVNFPQRSTWLVFLTLNLVFIAGQWAEGATYSMLGLLVSTVYLIIIGPKLRTQGVGGFELRDYVSLSVAGSGLVVWAITNEPVLALLISVVVDMAGAWLTVEKTYRLPWSETLVGHQGGLASGLLSAAAVGELRLDLLLIPGYTASFALIMVVVIVGRRRLVPRPY